MIRLFLTRNKIQIQFSIMSQKDSGHSSTQRTILWSIIPATVFVSLLLTNLNHKIEPPRERLNSNFGVVKTEVKVETPAMPAHDAAQPAEGHHAEPVVEAAPEEHKH